MIMNGEKKGSFLLVDPSDLCGKKEKSLFFFSPYIQYTHVHIRRGSEPPVRFFELVFLLVRDIRKKKIEMEALAPKAHSSQSFPTTTKQSQ
jgi:hypothetical protein